MGLTNYTSNSDTSNPASPSAMANHPSNHVPGSTIVDPPDILCNLNEKHRNDLPILFRDAIIAQTMSVLLGKNKPNALLIGLAGTGKTQIVSEIARMIANDDPHVPAGLKDHVIWDMPLSSLVSGTGIVGSLEAKLEEVLAFLSDPANKAIVFMDEIHQLTRNGDGSGYQKISQILKPVMARGDIMVIGATTSQEATKMSSDPAFSRRFTQINVDELTSEQTVEVLQRVKVSLEKHYRGQVSVPDSILEQVVSVADRFTKTANHRPDNAITLLDYAMADTIVSHTQKIAALQGDPDNDVLLQALLSQKVLTLNQSRLRTCAMKIATGSAKPPSVEIDELESALSHILGQDDAKSRIIQAVNRSVNGLFASNTPLTLMFAGPSGVGKTEIAKSLAKYLTNREPIFLSMTEYNSSASINRLIGSPPGYIGSESDNERPFDILETNPYQVICLDEFEKADIGVQRLFMGIFDQGFLTYASGKKINFDKAIIIATTNAGSTEVSSQAIGFQASSTPTESQRLTASVKRLEKSGMDIALINRFEVIVPFNTLNREAYMQILAEIYRQDVQLAMSTNRGINLPLELDSTELEKLADDTYLSEMGARPARRAVRKWIETHI